MGDPVIKSVVGWWFKLVAFLSFTAFLGVVMFIRTSIAVGMMTQSAYMYAGAAGVLMVLGLTLLYNKVKNAPEAIEGFLRRMGLYRDS